MRVWKELSMTSAAPWRRLDRGFSSVIASLLLGVVGCGSDDLDCGEQTCPVGTYFDEYRASREGFEVDVEVDVTSYSGEVAFRNFGEEECRYTCVVMQECPEWTFPVITEDCFTCATVEEGELVGGECEE